MKGLFFDKLRDKLDKIDPKSFEPFLNKLIREKGFLETVFNAIQEGIIVADYNHKIKYINFASLKLLGLKEETAEGMDLARVIRGVDWSKLLEEGQAISRDLEVSHPEHRFLNSYIVPLNSQKGENFGTAIILRDITETRKKTEEAIETEKINALMLLSASVAHELGNPLNSLGIHLQLMERDIKRIPDKESRNLREGLQICREEIKRLDHIISQFLQAVRPTEPDLKPEDLNTIAKDTLKFLLPELENREIILETCYTKNLSPIMADRNQLKQAFYNIVRNALQAMKSGGILRVITEMNDQWATISFADNGGGIPPEALANIFQPFYTTKKQGTGLGLMIVRRIIREHGGEIAIESILNKGTTIKIMFPLQNQRVKLLEIAPE